MSKENSYKIAKLGFFQNLPKILVEFLGVIIIASILIFLLKIETKKRGNFINFDGSIGYFLSRNPFFYKINKLS